MKDVILYWPSEPSDGRKCEFMSTLLHMFDVQNYRHFMWISTGSLLRRVWFPPKIMEIMNWSLIKVTNSIKKQSLPLLVFHQIAMNKQRVEKKLRCDNNQEHRRRNHVLTQYFWCAFYDEKFTFISQQATFERNGSQIESENINARKSKLFLLQVVVKIIFKCLDDY